MQLEDGPSAGYHGYWVTDFTQIDPHLGTNDELRALVDAAHARGMKVYFDIITNHTADVIGYEEGARTAYVPKDVEPTAPRPASPFDDRDYAGTNTLPAARSRRSPSRTPRCWSRARRTSRCRAGSTTSRSTTTAATRPSSTRTPTTATSSVSTTCSPSTRRVVDGMIDIYKTWIRDMGIDGFRIDTMKHVNDEFWQKFGPEVLAYAKSQGKSEFFMFGEVFDTTRPFTSPFTTQDKMQAVLDFPFQDAARNFASKSQPTNQLRTFFRNDDWYTDADSNVYQLPTFLGNHDMGRIGYFVTADNAAARREDELLARDRLAHELMYFSRGNPVIYYGDEQGFTGTGGDQVARQTMFASQVAGLPRRRPARHLRTPMRRTTSRPTTRCTPRSADLASLTKDASGAAQRRAPAPLLLGRGRHLRLLPAAPQQPGGVRGGAEQQRVGEDRRRPHLRRERCLRARSTAPGRSP